MNDQATGARLLPTIDRRRCEGKAACVPACPYDVLAVQRMRDEDYLRLPIWARLKSRVHGRRSAYLVNESACRACGACVEVCPEKAITLRPAG